MVLRWVVLGAFALTVSSSLHALDQEHASSPAVLFIADSHGVGPFGTELDKLLRESYGERSVETAASCGSSPHWWFDGTTTPCGFFRRFRNGARQRAERHVTPNIDLLLRQTSDASHEGGVVLVIGQGGNLTRSSEAFARRAIRRLLAAVRARTDIRKCIWVGPPSGKGADRERGLDFIYPILAEELSGSVCEFFDSRTVTRYPSRGGDGIHYGWREPFASRARAWAAAVRDRIVSAPGQR